MSFKVIIPARYDSQRLPGKVLLDVAGKPMIQRVYEQACLSLATRVIVATDDERVAAVVAAFGGEVSMTRRDHVSGTDRLEEVARTNGFAATDIIVNVQGDEPLMPPAVINQVGALLENQPGDMATLYEVTTSAEEVFDPNVVKVVADEAGKALYFSRAPVPWCRDAFAGARTELPNDRIFKRHLGIYAYRVRLLQRFVGWSPAPLELAEKLEQLRVLWHGEPIYLEAAALTIPPGIDTQADLDRTIRYLLDRERQ